MQRSLQTGGAARVCSNYGSMVLSGVFGKPDSARAEQLVRRGCELGDAAACGNTRFHLSDGRWIWTGQAGRTPFAC